MTKIKVNKYSHKQWHYFFLLYHSQKILISIGQTLVNHKTRIAVQQIYQVPSKWYTIIHFRTISFPLDCSSIFAFQSQCTNALGLFRTTCSWTGDRSRLLLVLLAYYLASLLCGPLLLLHCRGREDGSSYGAQSLMRESGCTRLPKGSYHDCSYVEEHRTQGVLLCFSGGRAINQNLSALTYTEYNLKWG